MTLPPCLSCEKATWYDCTVKDCPHYDTLCITAAPVDNYFGDGWYCHLPKGHEGPHRMRGVIKGSFEDWDE